MSMRFIPISICEVPKALAKHGDRVVLAELNLLLEQHGYRAQPLDPGQFVAAPEPPARHNHHALGKSPRSVARAKARVERMQKKGSRR